MGLTHHFDDLDDFADWLEERADEKRTQARMQQSHRVAGTMLTERGVYREIAEIVRTSEFKAIRKEV